MAGWRGGKKGKSKNAPMATTFFEEKRKKETVLFIARSVMDRIDARVDSKVLRTLVNPWIMLHGNTGLFVIMNQSDCCFA